MLEKKDIKHLITKFRNDAKPKKGTAAYHAHEMSWHTQGARPDELLDRFRPREDEAIKQYRIASYEPVTLSDYEKVHNTITNIFAKSGYKIQYPDTVEETGLTNYMQERYPVYKSFMNYVRQVLLTSQLTDPNGVLVIRPEEFDYYKNWEEFAVDEPFMPICCFYYSKDVISKKDGYYYLIYAGDKQYIYIDETVYHVWEIGKDGLYIKHEYEHGFLEVPAFTVRSLRPGKFYKSDISGVLPHWNKVINMESDMDGTIVNYLFPETWQVTPVGETQEFDSREKTDGVIINEEGIKPDYSKTWPAADAQVTSPYKRLQLNAVNMFGEGINVPIPPMGEMQKNTSIPELALKIIEDKRYRGYAAVNMEHISESPLNQSGKAKEYDRSELLSFLEALAGHWFGYVIPEAIKFHIMWIMSVPGAQKAGLGHAGIEEFMPKIQAPVRFQIKTADDLINEIESSKGLPSSYQKNKAIEVINRSINDPRERERLIAIVNLNPFYGVSDDDLAMKMANRTIKKEDWHLSNYIDEIVDELIAENQNFFALDIVEKRKLAREKALKRSEVIDINTIAPPEV